METQNEPELQGNRKILRIGCIKNADRRGADSPAGGRKRHVLHPSGQHKISNIRFVISLLLFRNIIVIPLQVCYTVIT